MNEGTVGVLESYPLYQCHKRVRAARIVKVEDDHTDLLTLHLEAPWPTVQVTREWAKGKHVAAGGFLVVYDDGYASFSPAAAFEGGYTRIL